jgi:transposase-like protein
MQDALREGTKFKQRSGENNCNASLSDAIVAEIMSLKDSGRTQKDIAREYGVNQSQISRWWSKQTRSHTN